MLTIAPLAFAFGSPPDWIILFAVALLLLGPKRLPDVGRQLGQAMREFNKIRDELTGAIHSVRDEVESAYEPVAKPYSQAHPISSATVDAAAGHRVYDQEPVDLMAPAVPPTDAAELPAAEHQEMPAAEHHAVPLPKLPVAVAAPDIEHEKGI